MLHETLWQDNQDLVQACVAHDFVVALGEGTLDPEAFKRYVAQDTFFLNAFAKAYAVALAKSETMAQVTVFHELVGGVLKELQLHAGYAESLGIDLDAIDPLPATLAYTHFLSATAWQSGPGEIMAAMVPCMRLYCHLGKRLQPKRHDAHPYREWIDTYASDEFKSLSDRLESLLDESAEANAGVRFAYRHAMRCEVDFFTAPL